MNLEIFNSPDPSGRFSKESFLLKNYPDEYEFIVEYCKLNKISDLTFKEKVYLCVNKLIDVPKCKNPECENIVKFKNSSIGYLQYCSNKCISSDPNIKKAKELKSIEKWGTKVPSHWYVVDGIRSHRFNWRKQKLIKLGFDSNKSEEEIMSELGYYKLYNGGNKKWILN